MYTLPYFGAIDPTQLQEYYQTYINLNATEIDLDLNFESTTIAPERLDLVKRFLEDLPALDAKNKGYINADFNNTEVWGEVRDYLAIHMDEFEQEELEQLIDLNDKSLTTEEQLVEKLKLVRIGFYPDNEHQFAICDYSLGVDYVLAIYVDDTGALIMINWES